MSEDRLQTVPVHRSLIRPDRDHLTPPGAERGLVVMLFGVVFILGWLTPSIPSFIVCAFLLTVGLAVLREMAKRDPIFSRVLTRRLMQQREYSAQAYIGANRRTVLAQQRDK